MILILQATIVSVPGTFYLVFPNPNAAFYPLSAITASLYLLMSLPMYAAANRPRYSRPDAPRQYRVPGENFGMSVIAGGGFPVFVFA